MFTCDKIFTATLEEKKSKFIAFLAPYAEFGTLFDSLKAKHPKARHLVTAFRHLNEHEQIVEGSSDDNEPRGTAGKPALHVLQGNELINICVIIVRYFGGIKLGTGGLVRAYSDAVNLTLKNAELIKYEKEGIFTFTCNYSDLSKVEYSLEQIGIVKIRKDFQALHVELEIKATSELTQKLKDKLGRSIQPISHNNLGTKSIV
ncbi:MAG: YigZ family protein [Sulfurospirillum sp.]